MGGSSKKKTTQVYEPPSWVNRASAEAIQKGRAIAHRPYQAYNKQRVADLSENEQEAIWAARRNVGSYQPYYDEATALQRRGTQQFKDANIDDYMNPYIKGALDPAAREISEAGQREVNALDSRYASMSAFGGSRAALARSQAQEKTLQSLSDLYGQGYAAAYQSAVDIWGGERARDLEAAGRFRMMGEGAHQMGVQDVSTLMTTGAMSRDVQQAILDFDYQQWTEQRDWDLRGLSALLASIQGTKGSYNTTTTSTTKVSEDNTAEYVGAAVQLIGMAFMASDRRLKDNIIFLGRFMGHKVYTWTWKPIALALGIAGPPFGVIAQEHPEATVVGPDGFLLVDYRKLFGGRHAQTNA
jgi:hypothetical protein